MRRNPDTESDSREGFLKRWSVRKQSTGSAKTPAPAEVREEAGSSLPLNTIVPVDSPGRMQTMVEADRQDPLPTEDSGDRKPVLTDADMPAVDSLDEHSNYSGFFSPGVSEALRRRAMRKLFSAAVFNVRDGLDDYDEDFTQFEPLGDMVTSDMKHQAEVQEKRLREAEEAEQRVAEESQEGEPDEGAAGRDDEESLAAESGAGHEGEESQGEPDHSRMTEIRKDTGESS